MSQILTYEFSLTGRFRLWKSLLVLRHWKRIFSSKGVLQSKCRATGVWCDRFVAEKVIFASSYQQDTGNGDCVNVCVCVERVFHLKLVAFYFNSQNDEVMFGLGWLFNSKYCRCIYFLRHSYLIYNTSIVLAVHMEGNINCLCFCSSECSNHPSPTF